MLRSCTIILSPFPLNFSSLTLLCTFNNWKYYVLWMLCNTSCSAGFKNFQVLWRICKNGKFRDSYKASLNVMCFVQMAKLNSLRKWTHLSAFSRFDLRQDLSQSDVSGVLAHYLWIQGSSAPSFLRFWTPWYFTKRMEGRCQTCEYEMLFILYRYCSAWKVRKFKMILKSC